MIATLALWSALAAGVGAKQLRAKVGPAYHAPSRVSSPYLSDIEYQHHQRSLVASTAKQPELLKSGASSSQLRARWKKHLEEFSKRGDSYDVCEKAAGETCTRTDCKTGATCTAFGRIKRTSRRTTPALAGNQPGSYCAISEKHKFIFVHVLKNAGSSTKRWLRDATDCPEDKHPCLVEMRDCEAAMLAYPDFFRWTWARHPFDRALSVYAMAKHYNLDPEVSFSDFWLAGKDRWQWTDLCPDHGIPQAQFMLSRTGCLAVDYVADLNNATAEWPHILDMIGSETLKSYEKKKPFMQPEEGNVFGTNEAAQSGVDNGRELVVHDEKLKLKLLEEFKEDFDLLGHFGD